MEPPGWEQVPEGWEKLSISSSNREEQQSSSIVEQPSLIVVLAGGIDPSTGLPHPWVCNRLERAKEIQRTTNIPILCCGGGTYHNPPYLNKEGFVVHESTACASYLNALGVKSHTILKEFSSYDTIGNAYFALVQHILPGRFERILVITSDFHMKRARFIFEKLNHLFTPLMNMRYEEVPDQGMDQEVYDNRKQREAQSLTKLKETMVTIHTAKDFWYWFHMDHQCYVAIPNRQDSASKCDKQCLQSY